MAAAALLLLLVSSSLAVASMSTGERSEEVETRRIFRDWMAKNKKRYSSIDEEEHRYAVFKEKLRRYGNHNGATDAAGVPIPLGLNGFGDLTDEELGSLNTGWPRSSGLISRCALPVATKLKQRWIGEMKRVWI
ncbi:hypothetical protein EJB05_36765, partial [Eragrostis curvula]